MRVTTPASSSTRITRSPAADPVPSRPSTRNRSERPATSAVMARRPSADGCAPLSAWEPPWRAAVWGTARFARARNARRCDRGCPATKRTPTTAQVAHAGVRESWRLPESVNSTRVEGVTRTRTSGRFSLEMTSVHRPSMEAIFPMDLAPRWQGHLRHQTSSRSLSFAACRSSLSQSWTRAKRCARRGGPGPAGPQIRRIPSYCRASAALMKTSEIGRRLSARQIEVRVVEDVEHLPAQLEVDPVGEPRRLLKGQVDRCWSIRPDDAVAFRVSERELRGSEKARFNHLWGRAAELRFGSALTLGRAGRAPEPMFARSVPKLTVNGAPDWRIAMPLTRTPG